MTEYNFDYVSIMDRVSILETEIERLKNENIQTTNELYEIQNRIDAILYNSIESIYNINFDGD